MLRSISSTQALSETSRRFKWFSLINILKNKISSLIPTMPEIYYFDSISFRIYLFLMVILHGVYMVIEG